MNRPLPPSLPTPKESRRKLGKEETKVATVPWDSQRISKDPEELPGNQTAENATIPNWQMNCMHAVVPLDSPLAYSNHRQGVLEGSRIGSQDRIGIVFLIPFQGRIARLQATWKLCCPTWRKPAASVARIRGQLPRFRNCWSEPFSSKLPARRIDINFKKKKKWSQLRWLLWA